MSSEQRRLAGRYVLETPIGRGGMGQVWRGTDSVLGREVAHAASLEELEDPQPGRGRFQADGLEVVGAGHPCTRIGVGARAR